MPFLPGSGTFWIMSLLIELMKIRDDYRPDDPEYQSAAVIYFSDLLAIAEAAQAARGELNRQIPHSKRTFNALEKLQAVDRVDKWPFRHNYRTAGGDHDGL